MAARETALQVLIACRKDGAWSNGALKACLQKDKLDSRDAALASRLSYGVLQNRGLLDFYLQQLLTGRLKNLHPAVRDILHLGLYQLYFMDKIPDSAAVNESVQLAKKYCRFPGASGLVNGVLRNAVRTRGQLKEPNTLWERYSHPKALVDLLGSYVGKERLQAMLKANNEIPPMVVQVNTLRATTQALLVRLAEEHVCAAPHSWLPDCLVLEHTGDLEQLSSFRDGLFYVQDAAARLAALCGEISPNARVLDCCAAPGGKSFAAAIAMGNGGEITSCDVHPHKVALIEKGAQRLGLSSIHAKLQDAAVFVPEWKDSMDVVLADVPCSGYGIIRKKPDIRYKDPSSMATLPELQRKILSNQASYVKPGGTLIYATCTLVKAENEDVVAAFLNEHPDFVAEPLSLPAALPENTTGHTTFVPGEFETDGFFICRMRRTV